MKKTRKWLSILLVMSLIINSAILLNVTVSKAADYTSAATLNMNGNWGTETYFTSNDTEHWYKVVIPQDGKMNIRMMCYSTAIRWRLYNSDLSKELSYEYSSGGTETSPDTTSNDVVLSAGTYYLKVNTSYDSGKYKICSSFTSFGVNDTGANSYDSPYVYSIGSSVTGAVTETDNEDWYKIQITKTGPYNQKITAYFGTLYWKLYNSDLSEEISNGGAYSGTETDPTTISDNVTLSAGTYYVKLSSSGRGKYTYSFNELTSSNCNHDYESDYVYATYFKQGYTLYTCKNCGVSYKDEYTSKKVLDQGYLYSYCYVGKGKIKLLWSTNSDASGYQIRYSKRRNLKSGASVKKIKNKYKSNKIFSGLARNRKYYFQMRPYKKSGSKIVYGKWSYKRCFKTK